ncbi:MAG: hypothetical protein KC486_10830 [Myxococcales bacterium]|nr:hypothetical protein [Myxococcales bacterium]
MPDPSDTTDTTTTAVQPAPADEAPADEAPVDDATKERLRVVPHTESSMDAKLQQNK